MTSASVTPLAALLLAALLGSTGTANAMPRPQDPQTSLVQSSPTRTSPARTSSTGHAALPVSARPLVAEALDPHRSAGPRGEAGNAISDGTQNRFGEAAFGRHARHDAEPYWTAWSFPPASPPYGLAASYPPPPYVPAYPRLPGYPPLPPR